MPATTGRYATRSAGTLVAASTTGGAGCSTLRPADGYRQVEQRFSVDSATSTLLAQAEDLQPSVACGVTVTARDGVGGV